MHHTDNKHFYAALLCAALLLGAGGVAIAQSALPDLPALPTLPSVPERPGLTPAPATPTPAATPAPADKVAGRASADSLDDLLPPLPTPTPSATPQPQENAAAPVPALPAPLPAPVAQSTTPPAPKKPKTLEEEAAEAGYTLERPSPVPDFSAQALLSGQPIGPDLSEDDAREIPETKITRRRSFRDLPPLKPTIIPVRAGYNYKRQILPPSIYRKEYAPDNRHLPLAVMREDQDRQMFAAVAANNINATRAYLNMGKSVDLRNARGETLLAVAVRYGALDTARLLLARGANPALATSSGATPRSLAESSGQRDLALVLAARGG